ncbi:MAG: indole-3-glycerol-phosphate synthase TrpC, partial [Proteobacteria bacterium]
MNRNQIFIAEVKTQSPFGFKSKYSYDYLFELAANHGDWVSIHTNPLFGGSYNNLSKAAAKTNKPILAKGFHRSNDEI